MARQSPDLPVLIPPDPLFDRVVAILEEARGRVVRAVSRQTVAAYWLIGREIVEALQGGGERAEYGTRLIEELSRRLNERYGRGLTMTKGRVPDAPKASSRGDWSGFVPGSVPTGQQTARRAFCLDYMRLCQRETIICLLGKRQEQ